jgi:hypothetical protein
MKQAVALLLGQGAQHTRSPLPQWLLLLHHHSAACALAHHCAAIAAKSKKLRDAPTGPQHS